jgi:hypothetical protein
MKKTKVECHECGAKVRRGDAFENKEDLPLCENCFDAYPTCPICDANPVWDEGEVGGVVLVFDDNTGVPAGCYQVTEHPFYWSDMISSSGLYPEALSRIGELPSEVQNSYPVHGICDDCKLGVLMEMIR